MYAFPVFLLFTIKDGVFIFWQHLFFTRHLLVPPLNRLRSDSSVLLKRRTDSINDFVDQL